MICDYDGREITGKPFKARMALQEQVAGAGAAGRKNPSPDSPEVGYRYFHDSTCYELFVADETEYEPL